MDLVDELLAFRYIGKVRGLGVGQIAPDVCIAAAAAIVELRARVVDLERRTPPVPGMPTPTNQDPST